VLRHAILLTLAGILPVTTSFAADFRLLNVASDHFDLYTTDTEAVARAALEHFETVRAYLIRSTGGVDQFQKPVRLVSYKSNNEFRSHLPASIEAEHAFSKINGDAATIVIDVLKKETYEYAQREYVNLLYARAAPKMPYWLRMGFREFYCTIRTGNGEILIGEDPHMETRPTGGAQVGVTGLSLLFQLRAAAAWGDTAEAVHADNKMIALGGIDSTMGVGVDPAYRLMALHLIRLLMFDKDYSPKFGEFTSTLANGADTTATIKSVYGQTLEDLAVHLRLEWVQPSHPIRTIKFALPNPIEPRISHLSPEDSAEFVNEIKSRK
jgi:hypothetical protein